MIDKHGGINNTNENQLIRTTEALKPSPSYLMKAINSFVKVEYRIRLGLIKARRLLHINFFMKNAMKKGIFYINFPNRLTMRDSDTTRQSKWL